MNWTEEEYAEYLEGKGQKPQKPSKYHSRRVWAFGLPCDSQLEADYLGQLVMLSKAGEIDGFLYHGQFLLTEGAGQLQRATTYEPDFIVLKNGACEIVDTKGMETPEFKLKMKILKEKYPKIEIRKRGKE